MKFDILRHGVAEPIVGDTHEAELARPLTPEGEAQVLKRRELLGCPTYDLALSSPAVRTMQTAHLACGGRNEIVEVPELCWMPGTPFYDAIGVMYKAIGHGTLARYRAHELGSYLLEHGTDAWHAVLRLAVARKAKRILVTGHFPFVTAMGYMASNAPWAREQFDAVAFSEAQGYGLSFEGARLADLVMYQS